MYQRSKFLFIAFIGIILFYALFDGSNLYKGYKLLYPKYVDHFYELFYPKKIELIIRYFDKHDQMLAYYILKDFKRSLMGMYFPLTAQLIF